MCMNRLRNFFVLSIFILLFPLISCGSHPAFASTTTEERGDTTLLDLFYGMEKHYNEDDQCGCILDSIPGVLKLEIESNWITYGVEENFPYQYKSSFCVYVDSIFPSQSIANQVSLLLDSLIRIKFVEYFIEERTISVDPVSDGHDILNNARKEFYALDSVMRIPIDQDTLPSILAFRTSFVAFKVFGNDSVSTYIFESSVDYNGSCGCPSGAIYYTMNNQTGDILTYLDIVGEGKDSLVYSLQYEEYCKEYKKKVGSEYDPPLEVKAFEYVMKDNCALVKDGILFYYQPYEIGSGAEGQYNLIIKI